MKMATVMQHALGGALFVVWQGLCKAADNAMEVAVENAKRKARSLVIRLLLLAAFIVGTFCFDGTLGQIVKHFDVTMGAVGFADDGFGSSSGEAAVATGLLGTFAILYIMVSQHPAWVCLVLLNLMLTWSQVVAPSMQYIRFATQTPTLVEPTTIPKGNETVDFEQHVENTNRFPIGTLETILPTNLKKGTWILLLLVALESSGVKHMINFAVEDSGTRRSVYKTRKVCLLVLKTCFMMWLADVHWLLKVARILAILMVEETVESIRNDKENALYLTLVWNMLGTNGSRLVSVLNEAVKACRQVDEINKNLPSLTVCVGLNLFRSVFPAVALIFVGVNERPEKWAAAAQCVSIALVIIDAMFWLHLCWASESGGTAETRLLLLTHSRDISRTCGHAMSSISNGVENARGFFGDVVDQLSTVTQTYFAWIMPGVAAAPEDHAIDMARTDGGTRGPAPVARAASGTPSPGPNPVASAAVAHIRRNTSSQQGERLPKNRIDIEVGKPYDIGTEELEWLSKILSLEDRIVPLVGFTGAGKTSLMKALFNIDQSDSTLLRVCQQPDDAPPKLMFLTKRVAILDMPGVNSNGQGKNFDIWARDFTAQLDHIRAYVTLSVLIFKDTCNNLPMLLGPLAEANLLNEKTTFVYNANLTATYYGVRDTLYNPLSGIRKTLIKALEEMNNGSGKTAAQQVTDSEELFWLRLCRDPATVSIPEDLAGYTNGADPETDTNGQRLEKLRNYITDDKHDDATINVNLLRNYDSALEALRREFPEATGIIHPPRGLLRGGAPPISAAIPAIAALVPEVGVWGAFAGPVLYEGGIVGAIAAGPIAVGLLGGLVVGAAMYELVTPPKHVRIGENPLTEEDLHRRAMHEVVQDEKRKSGKAECTITEDRIQKVVDDRTLSCLH